MMNRMQSLFKHDDFFRLYILPLLIIWLIAFLFLLTNGYQNSFLILNSHFVVWLDYPMLLITMLGDAGFLAALLVFILIRKQPYQMSMLMLTLIVSGIAAQLFKNLVFSDWDRPPFIFSVHTVANYKLYHRSFPSGHSCTVAAVFTMLAYFRREHKIEIFIYSLLCLIIAYSRIYLGVHFLGDALAGLTLGISISLLLLYFLPTYTFIIKPRIILLLEVTAVITAVIVLIGFFNKYLY
ncbi:MAG: phosphatase PAP2 family protein [Bacteroidales bacterium]